MDSENIVALQKEFILLKGSILLQIEKSNQNVSAICRFECYLKYLMFLKPATQGHFIKLWM